jgi:iron complex transport system ATP-binding protein
MSGILTGQGIVYRRGKQIILDGVDLSLEAGEVVSLLGVNGAGKSTLLRIMLGILTPDAGQVTLDGMPLQTYSRAQLAQRMAYVPQIHMAHFPYTASQMVAMGRIPHAGLGRPLRAADHAIIHLAMTRLDIAHLASRDYSALSGGERQRVLLARAIAQQAPILVMDEPLTGLDFGHQLRMLSLLRSLADDGYAILNTTHRPEEALHCANRAVLLDKGRIIADGPAHDVINEQSMSALYGLALRQVDVDAYRFLVPRP